MRLAGHQSARAPIRPLPIRLTCQSALRGDHKIPASLQLTIDFHTITTQVRTRRTVCVLNACPSALSSWLQKFTPCPVPLAFFSTGMRLTSIILLLLLACLAHGRQLASSNKNAIMAQLGSRGVQASVSCREPSRDVAAEHANESAANWSCSCTPLLQKTDASPGPKGSDKVRCRGLALAA